MTIDKLFYPTTIALIGASDKVGTIGYSLFDNLKSHQIYPVNPNLKEISGVKCYPVIQDIEVDIDLAIVAVPARIVPIIVDQIAQKGIKNIIVISSGFRESGRSDLEDLIKLICQKNNINLLGPNCLGLINSENSLNASFVKSIPSTGNIAFMSQSGALCASIIDYAQKMELGFSKFVSLGNKTCLSEDDFLKYFQDDPKTSVIAMYTEQLTAPINFPNSKPVIVLKSGSTIVGAKAAVSHTGALSGNDSAYDALFEKNGVTRVKSISEFFDTLQVFTNNPLPANNNLNIITNAGGVGVLTADAAVKSGLNVVSVNDLLGDATSIKYQQSLQQITNGTILVILTPQSVTEVELTAKVIIDFKHQSKLPIVACFLGDASVAPTVKLLRQNQVATIDFPENAIKALASYVDYSSFISRPDPVQFVSFPRSVSTNLLESFGLPIIPSYLAKNSTEALKFAQQIGTKLVLKISSPDILHKSDLGGVVLDIDPADIIIVYEKLIKHIEQVAPKARIDGVIIEEYVDRKQGFELILGSFKDPSLGHTLMIGAGGIYTEVIQDVAFGTVPVTQTMAQKMVLSLKVSKILQGVRGSKALDIESVIESIGKLSQLLLDHPEIKELDCNPLLVLPLGQGCKILDYRIITIETS